MSIFAPCPAAEFRRVLRPSGALVVASPGPGHLAEFRAAFYKAPQPLPPRASTDPDMQVLVESNQQQTSSLFKACEARVAVSGGACAANRGWPSTLQGFQVIKQAAAY